MKRLNFCWLGFPCPDWLVRFRETIAIVSSLILDHFYLKWTCFTLASKTFLWIHYDALINMWSSWLYKMNAIQFNLELFDHSLHLLEKQKLDLPMDIRCVTLVRQTGVGVGEGSWEGVTLASERVRRRNCTCRHSSSSSTLSVNGLGHLLGHGICHSTA